MPRRTHITRRLVLQPEQHAPLLENARHRFIRRHHPLPRLLIDLVAVPERKPPHDHAIQLMDLVESYREIASGLVDAYLSNVSNRMNEVMKTLTIVASIFVPLTFMAGIYGMNFEHMPELHVEWAYPLLLAGMTVTAIGMVIYFWRKGWIGRRR